jgi:hypothetical protein
LSKPTTSPSTKLRQGYFWIVKPRSDHGEATKVVTERLGHSTPAFTIHTYQHLLPGMSAAAAERFAALIAAPAR